MSRVHFGFDRAGSSAITRPRSRISAWNTRISGDVLQARYASRELLATAPYSPLAEFRQRESDEVMDDVARGGALASVSAFEPTSWTRVRFRLWRDLPRTSAGGATQIYDVGHISLPKRQSEIT